MGAGARPQFGVARPMKGGGEAPKPAGASNFGGDQFPPLPGEDSNAQLPPANAADASKSDAMT
ncbi:MAG: CpaF family protein, partial [Sphingomonadales bacterium]|nr:CpaF family protein [Sphingomonadales bacterium]